MPAKSVSVTGASPAKSHKSSSQTRKRRMSVDVDRDDCSGDFAASNEAIVSSSMQCTPRKVVKRVRFSDPGPELASTGLTPFIRRATLSPPAPMSSPRSSNTQSKLRRRSEPPKLPSLSTECSPPPSVHKIQFTPLRQTLDPRVRRRLRRSHLSEEMNDLQADKREHARAQNELLRLRNQSQTTQETIKQLTTELELQRLFGIEVNGEGEQRLQQLEAELADWKARAITVKDEEEANVPTATDLPLGDEAYEEVPTEPDSPWEEETFFSSPTTKRMVDFSSPISKGKDKVPPPLDDASCQTSLPDLQHLEQIEAFEAAVARLTRESSDAKSTLELVKDQLRTLGFSTEASVSADDVTSTLREAFRTARLQLEYLLPGETAGGMEDGNKLLIALVSHVKRLKQTVQADKKSIDRQQQIETALRGQFNATIQRVADLEQRLSVIESHRTDLIRDMESKDNELEDAQREVESKVIELKKSERKVTQLEDQAEEQCTSVDRLQAALITYRDEVNSLETLVTKMEKGNACKDAEISSLRKQLDVAIEGNQDAAKQLAKLRQDVQDSAFELSALAKPNLKNNVTQRRQSKNEKVQADEDAAMEAVAEDLPIEKADVDSERKRKSGGCKRDSGISMSDGVLETIGEEAECLEMF